MNLRLQAIKCLGIAIPAMVLSSCNDSDMGPEGSDIVVREIADAHRDFKLVDTSRERFRYQTRPASSADAGQRTGPRLVYATPKGWTDEGRSMMRDVNFSFGENGEGECYVARLPGAGGGLSANVNRWRKQMGAMKKYLLCPRKSSLASLPHLCPSTEISPVWVLPVRRKTIAFSA